MISFMPKAWRLRSMWWKRSGQGVLHLWHRPTTLYKVQKGEKGPTRERIYTSLPWWGHSSTVLWNLTNLRAGGGFSRGPTEAEFVEMGFHSELQLRFKGSCCIDFCTPLNLVCRGFSASNAAGHLLKSDPILAVLDDRAVAKILVSHSPHFLPSQ